MCPARPPGLPVVATVLVELRLDRKVNEMWFEIQACDGLEPTRSFGYECSTMPVSWKVEAEWLSWIDGAFGSALLAAHRAAGRLPVVLPAEYDELLDEEKQS